MGKLAERLADERRSGVYRVEVTEAVDEAAAIVGLTVRRVDLQGIGSDRLFAASASGACLGRSADAQEFGEKLGAAGWAPPPGGILVLEGFESLVRSDPESLLPLVAALRRAAERHRAGGRCFFAVFLDPCRTVKLDPLYDRRRHSTMASPETTTQDKGGDP